MRIRLLRLLKELDYMTTMNQILNTKFPQKHKQNSIPTNIEHDKKT